MENYENENNGRRERSVLTLNILSVNTISVAYAKYKFNDKNISIEYFLMIHSFEN